MSTDTKFIYICDRCKKECLPIKRVHWNIPNTESEDTYPEKISVVIRYCTFDGKYDANICSECLKEITGLVIK